MKILAVELSTRQGSVAWLANAAPEWTRTFANDRKHSGLFFENLQLCLRECGAPDSIAVGIGPGSYAGIRIAIATAIGLRAAVAAKLIGLASICAIETEAREYCVIGDARRESFFLGRVHNRRLKESPSLHSRTELMRIMSEITEPIFCLEEMAEFPGAKLAYPSAQLLARMASEQVNEMPDSHTLEPIYLREPYITVPKDAAKR